MTIENEKAGFRGAGLISFDPNMVLGRLNFRLLTLTPTLPFSEKTKFWVFQTPRNATDVLSQTNFVRDKIAEFQGSSSKSFYQRLVTPVKGKKILAYENNLLVVQVRSLCKANEILRVC